MQMWMRQTCLNLLGAIAGASVLLGLAAPQPARAGGIEPNYQIIEGFDEWWAAFQGMTEQLTISMLYHAQLLGMMMDGKIQIETQQALQAMQSTAHKDYLPSEALCKFGTATKSLGQSEMVSDLTQVSLAGAIINRQNKAVTRATAAGPESDIFQRFRDYRERFCDPGDYRGRTGSGAEGRQICKQPVNPSSIKRYFNSDIDYTRTLSANTGLTLDFSNGQIHDDEAALFALSSNLFANEVPKSFFEKLLNGAGGGAGIADSNHAYFIKTREIQALRSIAQNSFAKQAAMKARGPKREVRPYMIGALKSLGIEDLPMEQYLGKAEEGVSYDMQMQNLTKLMYQDPNFYVNLVDKPVNVERQRATMEAIGLMQKRDIYDAWLRREMLLSALLEAKIRNEDKLIRPQQSRGATASGAFGGI